VLAIAGRWTSRPSSNKKQLRADVTSAGVAGWQVISFYYLPKKKKNLSFFLGQLIKTDYLPMIVPWCMLVTGLPAHSAPIEGVGGGPGTLLCAMCYLLLCICAGCAFVNSVPTSVAW
jgi:hypothetical protein